MCVGVSVSTIPLSQGPMTGLVNVKSTSEAVDFAHLFAAIPEPQPTNPRLDLVGHAMLQRDLIQAGSINKTKQKLVALHFLRIQFRGQGSGQNCYSSLISAECCTLRFWVQLGGETQLVSNVDTIWGGFVRGRADPLVE